MTSTEPTSTITEATPVVVMWGEQGQQEIHLMADGEAYTRRAGSGDDCGQGYTCSACWRLFSPGWEFNRQGTREEAHRYEVQTLTYQVAELKRQMEQEFISIETVQQVASDYATQEEWCRVYEEAFTHLRTPYYPNGIPTLDKSTRVRVTITLDMDATASRRQRAGDIDFMRESFSWSRVRNTVQYLDPFDDDYSVDNVEVTDISVESID